MKRIIKKSTAVLVIAVIFLFFSVTLKIHAWDIWDVDMTVDASEYIRTNQEWTSDRIITGALVINEGVAITIKKGIKVSFDNGSLQINGTLLSKGTMMEGIKFEKSDGAQDYDIIIGSTGKLIMRNTDMSGGQIGIDGGSLDAQGCNFHNNNIAIVINNGNPENITVNRSKFFNNYSMDVKNNLNAEKKSNFQYNWWGQSDGPEKECEDGCGYKKIDGNINLSKWLTKESFHDPVVIIPGIFGSAEKDGKMQLDPVFHTYDNLYAEFTNNGYAPEKDLFVFPYEWRDSNIENAKRLKAKIEEIKSIANWPMIDVVAHSMGGLLAREYVESDYYGNDVEQLITLATPNLGAPEAYTKWEGDGWFWGLSDIYMKRIITQEAKEGNFADRFDYVHNRPVASLQELLPVYDYLYEADNGKKLRNYPGKYPRNNFLENLNNKSDKLNAVEYSKIIGNLQNNESTIAGIDVVTTDMGKFWEHGYPLGFEIPGDRGMRYSKGDNTVPLHSAKSENIKSDNLIELRSDHQGIVTDAQKDVLEILTAKRPITEVKNSLIKNIFMTQVFSPIDIQIVAPDGKRVGKDFITGKILNEIEGAYYTGYDTKNEFITIPNPIKGEYRILTEGTGNGSYKIETAEIQQGVNIVAPETINAIEGIAAIDKREEKIIEVKGVDTIPPATTIEISGTQGKDDWYLGNTRITLNSQDNDSGVENINYSLDNGKSWKTYTKPVYIHQEGIIPIQYFATDKQGINEEIKTRIVKIDKTPPDAQAKFNQKTQSWDIVGVDNISKNVSVTTNVQMNQKVKTKILTVSSRKNNTKEIIRTATLADEAGNMLNVVLREIGNAFGLYNLRTMIK